MHKCSILNNKQLPTAKFQTKIEGQAKFKQAVDGLGLPQPQLELVEGGSDKFDLDHNWVDFSGI